MEDELINSVATADAEWINEPNETIASGREDESSGFETSCYVEIAETPEGPVQGYRITRESFREKDSANEYMIIGIDAEYQAKQQTFTLEEVKKKQAKYEVLSYQYHAINDTGCEWSGIAIPPADERLSLSDFIVAALARGASQGQSIPLRIVLVGHYNKADLPAFDDRDKIFGHVNNIRNSMVSLLAPLLLRIRFSDDEEDYVQLKIIIRDSILMAPTGRQSLAELGKLIGVPKIQLADDPADERLIKQNMKTLRAYDWGLFRKYAIEDAVIAAKYFQDVTAKYQEATQSQSIPTALPSIGVKLLVQEWKNRTPPADPIEMVGKEKIKETIYDERSGAFVSRTKTPYIEELHWDVSFVTECYHGGRNEQMWFGPTWSDSWTDYDFSSAYPTAMALIAKPDWKAITPISNINDIVAGDLACACVDFQFPEKTRYPTLPVRTQHGIIFPLEGRSYCSAPEIELARNLGCKLTLKRGVVVPQNRSEKVFAPFIKTAIAKRQAATSEIENAFWKEITNSCYGKTAQGLQEKRVFNLKKKASERVPPSDITNPVYAAYITSYVRALVGEVMNGLSSDKMVFSVTTDGFITNATAAEVEAAQRGPLCFRFSAVRTELTGKPGIIEEKHNVRKLLGWRTRGQATLTPGDPTRSKPIILARAGIKPPVYATETAERNDYILDTFFNRTPKSERELEVHTSLREMITCNADLVSKKTPKHLNMEFDLKRRPLSAVQPDQGESMDREYQHISFSTVPWRTVGEFNEVRKCHNDYWAKRISCIKTLDDFADFAELYDGLKALGTKKAAYLKKKNGAVRRLQRDLCRAFKHQAGGLENYSEITSKQFADALNQSGMSKLGVKTTRSHVEYGFRKPFLPQTTPPTKEVLEILGELENIFPKLNRKVFLAEISNEWTLASALSTYCPFTDRVVQEAFNRSSHV